ncbi:MAG: SUMF1/EgtB/PvdO family nonheme iron enzyme [Rubrivivax sp.]
MPAHQDPLGGELTDPQQARTAEAGPLSLALLDARNRLLRWLQAFEAAQPDGAGLQLSLQGWTARHRFAQAADYTERWIHRNAQLARGEAGDAHPPVGRSHRPEWAAWLAGSGRGQDAPSAQALREGLADNLDTTLGLLERAGPGDAALHFFRQALRHEDRLCEALAEIAQEAQTPAFAHLLAAPEAKAERAALWMPAATVTLGSPPGGAVPDNERWAHPVDVPDFEIDAQPVNWAQYMAFSEDGGYDQPAWWSEAGWAWVQVEGRRAPRHVEQLRGSVLLHRQGRVQQVNPRLPVQHVSRFEAEAWCRWAGRRLPTEPEWTLAAQHAASRGFVWGMVFEWVAGSARPWPGHHSGVGSLDTMPPEGAYGVLRGASHMTRPRARHLQARRFAPPGRDTMFCGFRSCAL